MEAEVWGTWEDEGPYHVLANRSLADAAKLLYGLFEGDLLPLPTDNIPKKKKIWDCEYDSPTKPCQNKDCQHDHEEIVWEFLMLYEDEMDEEDIKISKSLIA